MVLDIPTLMFCDTVIVIFAGLILLFYKRYQKTYPGFGIWIAGTFITAIGYGSLIFRSVLPAYSAILLIHISFIVGCVMRYDGVVRFAKNTRLQPAYYLIPTAVVLTSTVCFYFFYENILLRNLVLSLGICFFAVLIAKVLIFKDGIKKRPVYFAAGFINLLFGVEIFLCAVYLLYSGAMDSEHVSQFLAFHQLFIISYETCWSLLFMMMNSRRLESELRDSQHELKRSVNQLEKAIGEIKTLSGLLPICSICKMVRDDKGYWNQIEAYISSHSNAVFSHSICPNCAKEHYPELDLGEEFE